MCAPLGTHRVWRKKVQRTNSRLFYFEEWVRERENKCEMYYSKKNICCVYMQRFLKGINEKFHTEYYLKIISFLKSISTFFCIHFFFFSRSQINTEYIFYSNSWCAIFFLFLDYFACPSDFFPCVQYFFTQKRYVYKKETIYDDNDA